MRQVPLTRLAASRPYPLPANAGRGKRLAPAHADHPVRRYRLRHAAVRAGVRARGHARADELRQSRAWRVRHGGRLHHGRAGQPARPAVPRLAAARLRAHRDRRRRIRAHALCARLFEDPSRAGAVLDRSGVHVGRGGRLRDGIAAAIRHDPVLPARPDQSVRHRHRPLPPAHHRDLRPADGRAAIRARAHALRLAPARRGR